MAAIIALRQRRTNKNEETTMLKQTLRHAAITLALAGLLASLAGTPALAQTYPAAKPIRVIIAFPPGGPSDAIGRVVFTEMSKRIGQSMVIDNRPGAGGNIATDALIAAPADGYTLLYASSSIALSPTLYKRTDLDPTKVLVPAGCSVSVPQLLLVRKDQPVNTAAELVSLIKASPDKYFQGSSGSGQIDHLVGQIFLHELGLKFTHVPYKGNGPAFTDLLAGNITFMFAGAFNSALPFIKDGRVKALAITSKKRAGVLPEVPSLNETVMKGFDSSTWQALMAPAGTPPAVLRTLNENLNASLAAPAVKESLFQQGAEIISGPPAQCAEFIKKEYGRWAEVIHKYDIHVD
jgi:tripartite-type tricarboxylate transporter receptor subunit TctC